MANLLSHLQRLAAGNGAAVMATLVATEGARPRLPGAKLLIGADGAAIGSVTLGGCVEARVAEAAQDVLEIGHARLIRVDVAAEDALDLGLSCAATLELLVEPVLPSDRSEGSLLEVMAWASDQVGAGRTAAVVVRLNGYGERLGVLDDGTTRGSLGSPALDAEAVALARTALEAGASAVDLVPESDERLFIDVFAPPLRLCVFGAGPVTEPLLRFARDLQMQTVLVEARAERLGLPGEADEVRIGSPGRIAGSLGIGARDAVVILSHDYKYELPVLEAVLGGEAGYVGMLGSRRRGKAVAAMLAERGMPHDAIARLRVPAGLDLGAEAPAEIALAILAEILALRKGRSGRPSRR